MRRARRIRMSLKFLALVLWSVIRQRAFSLKPLAGGLSGVTVTPQGDFLPQMTGGDKTPEEEEAEQAARKAEEEREAAEEEAANAEAEAEQAKREGTEWKGELDKERAERAVRNARSGETAAKEELERIKAENAELKKAQETEHETAKRERDEAKLEAERARENERRIRIDLALRDAAADADVPAKKVRRLLKLADRDDIKVDPEGNVDMDTAAEAVADVLDEFPEFKGEEPAPEDEEQEETSGGSPDRKRKPKGMTPERVRKMARDNPEEFNRLFDEGKIPESALAGLKS